MTDGRYQRGTPGPKKWGLNSSEAQLGAETPIITATKALNRAFAQFGKGFPYDMQWYTMFPGLEEGLKPITPDMDSAEQNKRIGVNLAKAQTSLMKITDEAFRGEGGVYDQAVAQARETGLLAKEGEEPTEAQAQRAAKFLRLRDMHAKYRAVVEGAQTGKAAPSQNR